MKPHTEPCGCQWTEKTGYTEPGHECPQHAAETAEYRAASREKRSVRFSPHLCTPYGHNNEDLR